MYDDTRLTRAQLGGALRAAWPFTYNMKDRPNISAVNLEAYPEGILIRATYARALVTIEVPCSDHGLTRPVRLSRDACKTIVRGVCKLKKRNRDDHVSLSVGDDFLRLRVQAHGTYEPLEDDHTDVSCELEMVFPDTSTLYLDDAGVPFTGTMCVRDVYNVADAVSQLARYAERNESTLPVRFIAGSTCHEIRVTISDWYIARFTVLSMGHQDK